MSDKHRDSRLCASQCELKQKHLIKDQNPWNEEGDEFEIVKQTTMEIEAF